MAGSLIIVSAPSGAGKTTLVRALLAQDPSVHLSVSYTTRAPRPGEIDGKHYHFIDESTFLAKREEGEFLEWAHVHGHYYATSAVWLESELCAGSNILLEIDWQGAEQVRKRFRDAIDVFILPPSLDALNTRLRGRGTDSEAVIQARLAAAHDEIKHAVLFQYVIVNADLEQATADLVALVRAAKLRSALQQKSHPELFNL